MRPILERGIKIVTNAGGLNPDALRRAIEATCRKAGLRVPKIAVVLGDDLLAPVSSIPDVTNELSATASSKSETIIDMLLRTNQVTTFAPSPGEEEPLWTDKGRTTRLMSCNAYLGAKPIARALSHGAEIVITGRVVDSALVLGPLMYEFGWRGDEYDLLSAGSLAGHVIECGAQCTGGNFTDWRDSAQSGAGWANMGFPIAEVSKDGSFVITKPPQTGGIVTCATVAEQILYEIHNPSAYALPDVTCDWTQVTVEQVPPTPATSTDGEIDEAVPRVRVRGARGSAPSPYYKLGATSERDFSMSGFLLVAGFEAREKALAVAEALIERVNSKVERMSASKGGKASKTKAFTQNNVRIEPIGAEATYGPLANPGGLKTREVLLRITAHHPKREVLELLSTEIASAATGMAPGLSALPGVAGRPKPSPVIRYHSALAPKRLIPWVLRVYAGCEGTDASAADAKPCFLMSEFILAEHEDHADDRESEAKLFASRMQYQHAVLEQVEVQMAQKVKTLKTKVGAFSGDKVVVPLITLAYGRSGDKGDVCNIGVIAREPMYLPFIADQLTANAVKDYMSFVIRGSVIRYPLPGLDAFNFVCTKSLDGGGSSSIALDGQGKAFAQRLLTFPVRVPRSLLNELSAEDLQKRHVNFYEGDGNVPALKWLASYESRKLAKSQL